MANGGWPSIERQESYISETTTLVARLVERGYRVRLVIGDAMDLAVMRLIHDRVQRPDQVECCDLTPSPIWPTPFPMLQPSLQTDSTTS